jgi:two-component system sensor histidine kinase KdpD
MATPPQLTVRGAGGTHAQPSPESFLNLIHRSRRGRLKVYLGYGPGVGKTYQMLLEGHRLNLQEIDVVVGFVETHGRADTESLCLGLPVIPPREVVYRGVRLRELDLEAVLKRKPEVVLIDELAHTNVPGSPNTKRYQDVLEVLAAGIHVITTLNVQHLESLYDTVERLIGVKVKERLPDWVIADADQIVNVDLSTEDLRKRLEEGRVYAQERVASALDHFFRKSNLEQLRELTMREIASAIERKSRIAAGEEQVQAPDQVVVCLSSGSPDAAALLRFGSRLAGKLNRNWYALYVQTPHEDPGRLDAETRRRLTEALALAQQLGAMVFTFKGEDIADTILRFAREYHVGHLVVGRPGELPAWQRLLGRRTPVERLIAGANGMAVVVVDELGVRERMSAAAAVPALAAPLAAMPPEILAGPPAFRQSAISPAEPPQGAAAARDLAAAERVAGAESLAPRTVTALEDGAASRPVATLPLPASEQVVETSAGSTRAGAAVARSRRFSELLSPAGIAFFPGPVSKDELLRALVNTLAGKVSRLSADDVLRLLRRREQEGSTFLGEGIALPHVRVPELAEPLVALGLPRAGLVAEAAAGRRASALPGPSAAPGPSASQGSRSSNDSAGSQSPLGSHGSLGTNVEQVFLILCPDRRPEGCLQLLALAARMFRDPQIRGELRRAATPEQALAAIRAWEEELPG